MTRPVRPTQPATRLCQWAIGQGLEIDLFHYTGRAADFGRHHHESCDLSLILHGELLERTGSRQSRGQASFLCLKPAGFEHSDHFVAETEILRLRIDPAVFRSDLELASYRGWRRSEAAGRQLLQWARDLVREQNLDDPSGRLVEILAATDELPARRPQPPWMGILEEQIEDRLDEPLRVRDLARELALHPVSMARAVRRVHGCSVRRLILRRRLDRATRELRRGQLSLADVATATGFSDQAHLTRRLGEHRRFTPGELRRLGRT
ncbi:MAG: AraC family transcriptional regulator [Acidobacteriota bacterium]